MTFRGSVHACLFSLALILGAVAAQEEPKKDPPKTEAKKKGLPLKPDRKIEFTTDEGTWLCLDVSPDGKTIVFELLGDLYTLPIEGGEATRITSGMAFDSQPRYSPDGSLIAFLSDRDGAENLWIMKADGADPKQLTKDKQTMFVSPAWTPDGEYVLVSKSVPPTVRSVFEIWMYHVKGGSGLRITKAEPKPDTPPDRWVNTLGPVASPDGRYLYYAKKFGGFRYNATFPMWQIARRDRVTGDEDTLTREPGSALRPLLSPDGRMLVYGTRVKTRTSLRIRDLATGEERWLKQAVQRDDQESRFTRDLLPGYAFTPDGKDVVAAFDGKIHRIDVATKETRGIPFTAKVEQELGPRLNFPERVEQGPVKVRLLQQPSQSSDGKRLAFSALTQLYTMNLPKGLPSRLTQGDAREFQPAWSRDGQWIAYVTWDRNGGHIWKTRADGSGAPERLTRVAGFYRDPVWTPDGTRIVALRASRQARLRQAVAGLDLIWIPAEGGEANLIVPARGAGQPHFSAELDRVYVYSSEGLISLRFDGTDRRTHLKVVGKSPLPQPIPAQDVRISQDGRYALALVQTQLYLLALPRIGGEPPSVNVESNPSVPVKKLTGVGADYFEWADGGRTIAWALGSTLFRRPLSSVVFEPPKKEEGEKSDKDEEPKPAAEDRKHVEEIDVALEKPRHRASGALVLRGARVITMRGDEVMPSADVVVQDNRIAGVGKRGSAAIPAGAKILDVSGSIIMPGFVDTHAHWFEIGRGVLELQNWAFLANLAYGVTTGRDPQTGTNDIFAYQDLVDTGEILGPRAFSTGPGVFSGTDFQSLEAAKSVVSKYKKHYRTHTLKSYMVGNRQQRQWMVEACKEHGIMPTTEGGLDMKMELTHAIDGFSGNEHSIPIVPLYNDVVELVARSGLFYTPTLLVAYGGPWAENYFYETTPPGEDAKLRRFTPPEVVDEKTRRRPQWFLPEEHIYPKLAAGAAKIIRAGGRVCIGSHGQLQGLGYHWELWALHSGGLTNHEALRAATLHGAEAIGYAQDVGSIEPGKLADLLVLAKDPLQDIHNTLSLRYVVKDGELFEADTLNQVWPREKPLAPLWWWKDEQ